MSNDCSSSYRSIPEIVDDVVPATVDTINMMSRMAGYDDGRITCADQEIVIRHYYLLGPKHISYTSIRQVRQVPLGAMGKWRIHGSGDLTHWFNFDPRRPRKTVALVIYLDQRIRPVITPDDPERVVAELAAHGVNVTSGQEPGLR